RRGARVGRAELRELLHEARRHPLRGGRPHVDTQGLLEAVAPAAVVAAREVLLGLRELQRGQRAAQIALEQPLALAAVVATHWTASSASCAFSSRRPRWSLDMTVPSGMAQMCADTA